MLKNEISGYYKYDGTVADNLESCDYVSIKLLGALAKKTDAHTLVSKQSIQRIHLYALYMGKNGYCIGYKQCKKRSRRIKLHRFIFPHRIPKFHVVDHINNNKLDNTMINLRICTAKQNSYNTKVRKGRKYKGVRKGRKDKDGNVTWVATISKDGKKREIKDIKTEEDAAKMYDIMAEELFGEYAGKNFN